MGYTCIECSGLLTTTEVAGHVKFGTVYLGARGFGCKHVYFKQFMIKNKKSINLNSFHFV